ncbi:hypothetical protein [Aquimarina agarilytica]|uniref:hypothetical protein n=1 Tax=Aquimarina agarilytica TaxID=1087449 RepID=UPI000289D5AC|nr:hypothetical protein [Aquimarina agarilytica]
MNNFYGLIFDKISKESLSIKFKQIGWHVRKSGFNSYEITSEWAELNIEGESEILLNGEVELKHFDKLEKLIISFNLKYSLELYDNENQLIKRFPIK